MLLINARNMKITEVEDYTMNIANIEMFAKSVNTIRVINEIFNIELSFSKTGYDLEQLRGANYDLTALNDAKEWNSKTISDAEKLEKLDAFLSDGSYAVDGVFVHSYKALEEIPDCMYYQCFMYCIATGTGRAESIVDGKLWAFHIPHEKELLTLCLDAAKKGYYKSPDYDDAIKAYRGKITEVGHLFDSSKDENGIFKNFRFKTNWRLTEASINVLRETLTKKMKLQNAASEKALQALCASFFRMDIPDNGATKALTSQKAQRALKCCGNISK